MKKSLIALSVFAAASAFAGGGLNTLNNVAVQKNGIGDLLIAPVFAANNLQTSMSSELKLINNSTIYSTAVKVVFHNRADSAEVLDFFVYLSPGDTWTGIVTQTASGTLQVNTQGDDSTPQATNGIISGIAGADFGYIVVHENAAWNLGPAPVSKSAIIAQLAADTQARTVYREAANRAVGEIGTENIVSGSLRLLDSKSNTSAALPLLAIGNYNNRSPLTLSALTLIGNDQVGNLSSSYTNLASVEALLWGNDWAYSFDYSEATTVGSFTFPTRHTFDNANHGVTFGTYPFANVAKAPVRASVTIRDMSEGTIANVTQIVSPIPSNPRIAFAELGFFTVTKGNTLADQSGTLNNVGTLNTNGTVIPRGWVDVNLDGVVGTYANAVTGVPAIATQINYAAVGNNLAIEWQYPAFKVTTGTNTASVTNGAITNAGTVVRSND